MKGNIMKNSIRFIRTLLTRNRSTIVIGVTFSILGLGLIIISALLADPMGESDYLISVTGTSMGYTLIYMFSVFTLISFNTRFFHSSPLSEHIMTTIVPWCAFFISLISTLLAVIFHFIALSANIVMPQRLSDLMLLCAYSVFMGQLSSGFWGLRGGLLCAYGSSLPYVVIIFSSMSDSSAQIDSVFKNGFGVPTHISAIILVIAFITSVPLSIFFAKRSYKKRSSGLMNVRMG